MINDIIAAIRLMKDEYTKVNTYKYNKIYLFTNENISAMTKELSLYGTDVLTVCSSGDHIFNFLLEGVSNIETFDINILAEYIFYLKKAAIEVLSYEEFLDFFFPKHIINKNVLSKDVYNKIKINIQDERIKVFWDYLLSNFDNKKVYKNLFTESPLNKKTIISYNKYLSSESNYNLLKAILRNTPKINFYNIDILSEIPPLKRKIDFLYLSNILGAIYYNNNKYYLEHLKKIILNLSNIIKEGGNIGLCYLYCYLDYYWLNSKNNIQSITVNHYEQNTNFPKEEYQIINFHGMLKTPDPKNKDALILYKKQ